MIEFHSILSWGLSGGIGSATISDLAHTTIRSALASESHCLVCLPKHDDRQRHRDRHNSRAMAGPLGCNSMPFHDMPSVRPAFAELSALRLFKGKQQSQVVWIERR